jgi:hypothetical protein
MGFNSVALGLQNTIMIPVLVKESDSAYILLGMMGGRFGAPCADNST